MTVGEKCAEAVREYLFTNGLRQSQLTGRIMAELIDRVLAHEEQLSKKRRRLATEEDWIKSLESEPHLAGVNVRRELAACQFWCKNNSKLCTRRRFGNWLDKAERSAVISEGGAKPDGKPDLYHEPTDWRASERARLAFRLSVESWKLVCERNWFDLSTDMRATILKAL